MQAAYDLLYVGPQDFGQTYDPPIFPVWDMELMKAIATARLAGGLETMDDVQARKHIKPVNI